MFISAASSPGAGPAKALLVITTLSGFVAWCCAFYICMLLFRISAAIQVWSFRPQQAEASQLVLAYNKFWKTLGVFIATNLIVGFLLTFMFMALGASLAPVFGSGN
jgi:accessory gene regulator protein AgrB